MEEIIIPIAICVVLPIAVVFIFYYYSNKKTTSRINLLSKAIESGVDIDPKILMEALDMEPKNKTKKSIKSRLVCKLQWGVTLSTIGLAGVAMCIIITGLDDYLLHFVSLVCLAPGIGLIIAYCVGRKIMAEDMALELKVADAKADADAAEIKAKSDAANAEMLAGTKQAEE